MKLGTASLTVTLLTSCWCSALPPKEHKDRAIDPRLSDKEHDLHGEHNNDYDHDAFLGEDEAKEFDDLSPEESKRRLGIIVDKIDKDGDGFVTENELKHWIQYVQKKYVMDDTDRMWKSHENDLQGDRLSWDSYRNHTYGYQYEMNDDSKEFHNMLARDERRFKEADKDADGKLTFEEFTAFVHPEEYKHMEEVVVLETIEDIDKDNDGLISLEEYIADIYDEEDEDEDEEDPEEIRDGYPEWVHTEIEQFKNFRDRNQDGHLDVTEVKEWVIPEDYDSSNDESRHLMNVADIDRDDKLSKEEILAKYDVFVGSQATDFGEALTRHDEF